MTRDIVDGSCFEGHWDDHATVKLSLLRKNDQDLISKIRDTRNKDDAGSRKIVGETSEKF